MIAFENGTMTLNFDPTWIEYWYFIPIICAVFVFKRFIIQEYYRVSTTASSIFTAAVLLLSTSLVIFVPKFIFIPSLIVCMAMITARFVSYFKGSTTSLFAALVAIIVTLGLGYAAFYLIVGWIDTFSDIEYPLFVIFTGISLFFGLIGSVAYFVE